MSPFEALYGRTPPSITSYIPGNAKIGGLDDLLTQHHLILKLLKENLVRARNRMVQQANKKRKDKTFAVNQWVYLKLQPYRQISVKDRSSQKLAKRFYGPFRILKRIGAVAYELELPPSARIHPVFHVSLLKEFLGHPDVQIYPLPPQTNSSTALPTQLLGMRTRKLSQGEQEEVLIQWDGQDTTEATWEDKATFKKAYPDFDLEDKIIFEPHGNDTMEQQRKPKGGNSIALEIVTRPKRKITKLARLNT